MARPKYSDSEHGRKTQEEKYQRILDAALEVFADKGFHEAKVTEIARVAGVADGTIYLYFKNKDDLVVSLIETKLTFINELMKKSLSDIADARDRVHHMVRFHMRIAYENPSLTRFLTIELRRGSAFVKSHAQKAARTYLENWGDTFELGQKQGHFRADLDAGITRQLVFGALDYACMAWVDNPDRTVEQLNRVMKQTTDLILHGVAASREGAVFTPTPDFPRLEA